MQLFEVSQCHTGHFGSPQYHKCNYSWEQLAQLIVIVWKRLEAGGRVPLRSLRASLFLWEWPTWLQSLTLQCYGSVNHELENAPSRPPLAQSVAFRMHRHCVSPAPHFHFSLGRQQKMHSLDHSNTDTESHLSLDSRHWSAPDNLWQSWRQKTVQPQSKWLIHLISHTQPCHICNKLWLAEGLTLLSTGLLCTLHFRKEKMMW